MTAPLLRVIAPLLFTVLLLSRVSAADLVLTGATAYPAPGVAPIVDAVVVIDAGRITAVGPRDQVAVPAGVRVLDCRGRFVTAGFWNSHVHILTPSLLTAATTPAADLAGPLDAMFNQRGFTTVFDLASPLANTLALRDRIESGELRGPRLLSVGEPIWTEIPFYVHPFLIAQHVSLPPLATPAEAVARVRALAANGARGIKLFTGSLQEKSVTNMSVELVRAAVDEAHRRHLPVFAHPQNTAGLDAAIAGGVDVLAHTAPQSPDWTPEFVARLKQAHIALIPTLTLFDVEGHKAGFAAPVIQEWIDHVVGELRAFSAGGGEVLFGTDIGYIDQFDPTEEFQLMGKAGLDFPRILASLTTAPAARFGFGGRSGRIAAGFDADLVILDRDPAADITALAAVHQTIRAGRIIYGSQ